MVGKPVVQGTRIPVEQVIQHLADTADFSDLTPGEVESAEPPPITSQRCKRKPVIIC